MLLWFSIFSFIFSKQVQEDKCQAISVGCTFSAACAAQLSIWQFSWITTRQRAAHRNSLDIAHVCALVDRSYTNREKTWETLPRLWRKVEGLGIVRDLHASDVNIHRGIPRKPVAEVSHTAGRIQQRERLGARERRERQQVQSTL